MLRRAIPAIGGLAVTSQPSSVPSSTRAASSHSRGKWKPTEQDELAQARLWLKDFTPDTIPTRISREVTIRDKLLTRHQQRTPLSQLLPLIPKPMHEAVRKHRYYSATSDDVVITSTDKGSITSKRSDCSRKMYAMVCEIGKEAVPPERTPPDESSKSKRLLDSHSANKKMKRMEVKRFINEVRNAQQVEKRKANIEQQTKDKYEHRRQQRESDRGRHG